MHRGMSPISYLSGLLVFSGALALTMTSSASADSHLPIVDIVPTTSYSLTGDGVDPNGGPNNPPAINGATELNGSVMLPLAKGLSIGYNRASLGGFDANLSSFIVGGKTIYPGGVRDLVQTYVVDYHVGRFNVEGGFGSRYRRCCPADSFTWHKGFLGVSYTTPSIALLNHGFFVLDITGNSSHHYSSPQALAAIPPGLSLPNNTQIYTTQQAITAVIPVDPKNGVRTAATFLWGALDYPKDGPFPYYYDVFILSGTKQFTNDFGITANVTNVKQRVQGSPFPAPFAIRDSALTLLADFHVDFNKFLHHAEPATTPGRPTVPGAPGGPGGPAQVGPTQGGTVTPAPTASPKP